MDKNQRILAALKGESVDHIPFSFWTHMAGGDLDPELLAAKTYEFYREFNLDFIKTMNNGMYSVEDYGCILDQSQVKSGGITRLADTPVKTAADWRGVTVRDISQGALGRQWHPAGPGNGIGFKFCRTADEIIDISHWADVLHTWGDLREGGRHV